MSSLRAAATRQAPLFIALSVIALVIAFTRKPKLAPQRAVPTPEAFTPSAPQPIPEEPPFGALRVENSGLPCAVDQVLASKCRRCHATPARHGAPFPLYTWAEVQTLRASQPLYRYIGRAVQSGFMPIRIPANPPVEPLTDDEKKTLLDWVDAGAPSGSCASAGASAARPRSSR